MGKYFQMFHYNLLHSPHQQLQTKKALQDILLSK